MVRDMIYKEEMRNIFKLGDSWALAHFISSDGILNSDIAKEFEFRYKLESSLQEKLAGCDFTYGYCIAIDGLYSLVVKRYCYDRPTYKAIRQALEDMRDKIILTQYHNLAIPMVTSSFDKLEWCRIAEIIQEVFKGTDIEICVCKKRKQYELYSSCKRYLTRLPRMWRKSGFN